MGQSAKVAITIPGDIYRKVERLRKETHVSRSGLVQKALVLLLRQSERDARIRAYVEGYRENPETDEEIQATKASANMLLSEVPWE